MDIEGLLKPEDASPILIIVDSNSSNPFGTYTEEILKTEGFNEFEAKQLSDMNSYDLWRYNVVILTETKLTLEQADMFKTFAAGGGSLIAFKPDKKLAPLFGIEYMDSFVSEGYILVDTRTEIGRGITRETMQFHGEADKCNIVSNSSQTVAELYTDADTAASGPAVVFNQYHNGLCVAFTYDLNRSIILTRQGNPDWSGLERDGLKGVRASDMFLNGAYGPYWIDSSKVSIPQADEQMRLLSHAIERLSSNKLPLPRTWYFPYGMKSLVIFTGDGEHTPVEELDRQIKDIQSWGGNMTLYIIGTYIDPHKVQEWIKDGNEISVHYNAVIDDLNPSSEVDKPTYKVMNKVYDTMTADFKEVYGFLPQTVRNHWVVWCGWSEQAEIEANHGLHFDCNYYHFDYGSSAEGFLGDVGFFTGSGLPMKFCDKDGSVLDIYQSATQIADEHWRALIAKKFNTLLHGSLYNEAYTFINANFHPERWKHFINYATEILQLCSYYNIPVWTAQKTLEFLQMKDTSRFSKISWFNNTLRFQLEAPIAGEGLTFMLPIRFKNLYLSTISMDDTFMEYVAETIKGKDYALVVTSSGKTCNVKAIYGKLEPNLKKESILGSLSGTNSQDGKTYELGTVFQASCPGNIIGIRGYGIMGEFGDHYVTIWNNAENQIAGGPYIFNFTGENKWIELKLPEPIKIEANTEYTISMSTGTEPEKNYASIDSYFTKEGNNNTHLSFPANAGVYSEQLGTRPTQSYKSRCYLRDIIFLPD